MKDIYSFPHLLCRILVFGVIVISSTSIFGQDQCGENWQTYSPPGAEFSILVPSEIKRAQGHIFDPKELRSATQYISGSKNAKVHNFEFELEGKRMFLVSTVRVDLSKVPVQPVFTQALAEKIGWTIGDEYRFEGWSHETTGDGESARWNYKTRRDGEGTVRVMRNGSRIVLMVVDFDFAEKDSKIVEKLVRSLRLI